MHDCIHAAMSTKFVRAVYNKVGNQSMQQCITNLLHAMLHVIFTVSWPKITTCNLFTKDNANYVLTKIAMMQTGRCAYLSGN